jgi:hypothetical protein
LYLDLQSNTIIYPYTCSLTLVVQPTLFNFVRSSKYWYNIFEAEDAQGKKHIRCQTLLIVFSEEVRRGGCTAAMAVKAITYLIPRAQADALALYKGAWKGLLYAKEWN